VGALLIAEGMRSYGFTREASTPYVGMRLLGPAWIVVLITGVWMVLVSAAWKFSKL
jgi:hypothetical protein